MENELEIRTADVEDINTIGWLAQQIWPTAYKDILSKRQLEYMLQLMYSPAALKEQMDRHHRFLIAEIDEAPVGFASYSAIDKDGTYKLHKLYLLPHLHGKGLGKTMLDFVIEEITPLGAAILRLNMNRQNKAKTFYEKYGFKIVGEEDVDIGYNFFMNDFVMEMHLPPTTRINPG